MALNFGQGSLFGESRDLGEGFNPDEQQKTIRDSNKFWSVAAGSAFQGSHSLILTRVVVRGTLANENGGVVTVMCQVELPQNAVVTSAVVYGSGTDTWILYRGAINSNPVGTVMATANIGTADTSISNATIDNFTYKYWFTAVLQDNEHVYGTKIIYTG